MNHDIGERWASALRYLICMAAFQWSDCTAIAQPPAAASQPVKQQLIVVIGAPGTEEYRSTFNAWGTRWQTAAQLGGADCITIGAEADTMSDIEVLTNAVHDSISVETAEPLWIVFIGHGTFDGRMARFNLKGPDVSAEKLAELLRPARRPLAFIACASCSAPFLNALSAPGRIVISATKDGNQIQYSRFGDAMSQAISGLEADINRDGQTSLLEAWLFAARRTADFYATEGRLATEHALLDDNGDGKGTRADAYELDRPKADIKDADQIDGSEAGRWYLIRSEEERRLTPEQRRIRDELEKQLEELRRRRKEMTEEEFLRQLEALLVPLARLYESTYPAEFPPETPKK
jgi:hypothetical protein